jgi:hypothetical protein
MAGSEKSGFSASDKNPDDILKSVREDGCFKSPEAAMATIYAGYVWRIMFWITITLWNIYTAIDSRRK